MKGVIARMTRWEVACASHGMFAYGRPAFWISCWSDRDVTRKEANRRAREVARTRMARRVVREYRMRGRSRVADPLSY